MSGAEMILVIEDEPNTRTLIQVTLGQSGYHCVHAATGIAGVAAAFDSAPSAVLLDLGLPDLDGVEVTRRIRERSPVPIIVVSARGQEKDKIEALDGGANDYVTKPFGPGELLARIRVALRAAPGTTSEHVPTTGTLTIGDLSMNLDLRTATVGGAEVYLTPIEYRLLAVMMASSGRVLTHQEILRQVWGPRYAGEMNYLRVYMKKLRHKIEPEPARPKYLVNEPGIGYRVRSPKHR
jgi:two-component system, OmpR family, KDP operon response regulator KdpE